MVNILIADDNIEYAIYLMNCINKDNKYAKICNIAKNGKEAIEMLNQSEEVDIILLDYKMPFYNGDEVLNLLKNKEKYINSCIIISEEIESVLKMTHDNIIHSVIFKTTDINEIMNRINELIEEKEKDKISNIYRNKIIDELLYLGYDISHKGTQYLIEVIEYIILNPDRDVENLEKNIYPVIAELYKSSVHNVKCRINNATTVMYYNCEVEKLKKYFNFYTDVKPKVKTIINTVTRKVV